MPYIDRTRIKALLVPEDLHLYQELRLSLMLIKVVIISENDLISRLLIHRSRCRQSLCRTLGGQVVHINLLVNPALTVRSKENIRRLVLPKATSVDQATQGQMVSVERPMADWTVFGLDLEVSACRSDATRSDILSVGPDQESHHDPSVHFGKGAPPISRQFHANLDQGSSGEEEEDEWQPYHSPFSATESKSKSARNANVLEDLFGNRAPEYVLH